MSAATKRKPASCCCQRAVREAVLIIDRALRQAGVAAPRIAVSGLNPHAGDGGSIGLEEIEILAPAVGIARNEGLQAAFELAARMGGRAKRR